jgi:hypothetical protein
MRYLIILLIFGCSKFEPMPVIDGIYKHENFDFWIVFDEGNIEAYSLVNQYDGIYEVEGCKIEITRITGTKVYETNGFNEVRELRNVKEFDRYNSTLILKGKEDYIFKDITKTNKIY